MRCTHELRYHTLSAFLTLTYDNQHLPPNRNLRKQDLTLFFKLLRYHTKAKLKYFACGEYGDKRGRPHYHVLLFGYNFPDLELIKNNDGTKYPLYHSKLLDGIWKLGNCTVGTVTDESADYVARYTLKKQYGNKLKDPSKKVDPYCTMSKGIGERYYNEFKSDMYPSDFLISLSTGRRQTIPRYYDKKLAKSDPDLYLKLKAQRKNRLDPDRNHDYTARRLTDREQVRLIKIQALQRHYDQENICPNSQATNSSTSSLASATYARENTSRHYWRFAQTWRHSVISPTF